MIDLRTWWIAFGSWCAVMVLWVVLANTCSVGGREQLPSGGGAPPRTSRATQTAAAVVPALDYRAGGDNGEVEGEHGESYGQYAGRSGPSSAPAAPAPPTSTVVSQALTAAVVATPVTTAPPVETFAPRIVISYAPWPEYLWPTVACLIQRESRGEAGAVGRAGERGLLQVGPANFGYLAGQGISPDSLFDAGTNIRAGWILYVWWQGVNGDGLTPWASTRGGCA